MYEAIFQNTFEGADNPFASGLMRTMVWTQFMLQCCWLGRACLMSTYSPHRAQVELPSSEAKWDVDGYPKYALLHFREWKGNSTVTMEGGKDVRVGKGPLSQDLYIERNYIRPEYCPVVTLLNWLKLSGIEEGPIFPLPNSSRTGLFYNTVYPAEAYEQNIRLLFDYVGGGLAKCSSHSMRKAGVAWAARCGVPSEEIVRLGRWKTGSTSYQAYSRRGLLIQQKHLGPDAKQFDPILSFWAFPSKVLDLSG